MARYIDADVLKWRYIPLIIQPEEFVTKSDIEKAQTVDVVQVVRCKDCKHNSLNRVSGNAFCDLGIGLSQIYDFCSHGERRDDG